MRVEKQKETTKIPNDFPDQGNVEHGKAVENISRRGFLNTASIAAVGGLVVVAGGGLLDNNEAEAGTSAAPMLPWKYTKIDPLEAGKRGYKFYLQKGG